MTEPRFAQLSRACARAITGTGLPGAPGPAPGQVDFAFIQLALQHAVLPLISAGLPEGMDDDLWLQVRLAERQLRCEALARVGELIDVVSLLSAHSIPVLAIKGPVLSAQLYGDASVRVSGDLDFMLGSADLVRALSVLSAAGYQSGCTINQRTLQQRQRYDHEIALWSASGLLIELQWRWAQPHFSVAANMEETFRGSTQLLLGGTTIRTMGPVDTALYLAVHGAKHGWNSLAYCCDFARTLVELRPDFAELHERAVQAGLERVLDIALLLSDRLFDLRFAAHKTDPRARALAARYHAGLAGGPAVQPLRLFIASRERTADLLAIMVRLSLQPSAADFRRFDLPAALQPLYYLLRPLRLSFRTMQRVFHQV